MLLTLETTTGKLVPAGHAPQLGRGTEPLLLRFVTNGVAAMLEGEPPIALKLFLPADQITPIVTVNAWTELPDDVLYRGELNTLAVTALAWLLSGVLVGRLEYGDPTVQSSFFQLNYGGPVSTTGGTRPSIVIMQPAGPVHYMQQIGYFQGKVVNDQVEGYWQAPNAAQLKGLALSCQVAPSGADLIVELVVNAEATGKTFTLGDGSKAGYADFGAPHAINPGDIVQFKPTQHGSARYLSVQAKVQLT